jgi:hypothetical protein
MKLSDRQRRVVWASVALMLVAPSHAIFSQADSTAVRTARLDAVRLLQLRQTGPLIAEPQTVDRLASAIMAIHSRFPDTRDVRPMRPTGIVVVYDSTYSSVLANTIVYAPTSGAGDQAFKWLGRTGDSSFDALTRRIGGAHLQAWFLGTQRFILDLDEVVATRLDSATILYRQLPHVREVYSNYWMGGGGSDVQMREIAGEWEFTFGRGWGDCVGGCAILHSEVIAYQPRTGSVRLVSETGPKPPPTPR